MASGALPQGPEADPWSIHWIFYDQDFDDDDDDDDDDEEEEEAVDDAGGSWYELINGWSKWMFIIKFMLLER